MTLKENSKAKNKSIYLLGSSIILLLINVLIAIFNSFGMTRLFVSLIPSILSMCFFAYIVFQLYKKTSNDIEDIFLVFLYYLIASPICIVLIGMLETIIYQDIAILMASIISAIIGSLILYLLPILGIHILKTDGSASFLKKVLIIELILTVISNISVIIRAFVNVDFSSIFSGLPMLLFYLSLYLLANDTESTEKEMQLEDLKEVDIAKSIIFSIITLGIYGIIWLYKMARTIKTINNDKSSSGGEIVCLMLVPFYMIYWVFTRTKIIKAQADNRNLKISDNAVLYLVLSLFGLNIISVALMQNDLNMIIKNKNIVFTSQNVINDKPKETTDIEKITQLSELKEKGILTEEEYQKKKQEILDRI